MGPSGDGEVLRIDQFKNGEELRREDGLDTDITY
jgi:hypothetical protein